MEKIDWSRRRGFRAAAGALGPAGLLLLAACGPRIGGPAPLVSGAPPPPTQIIVERGQTLSGIAHAHHLPMQALAEANRLAPPYRILVGQALIIPGGAPSSPGPALAMAEPMPPPSSPPPYPPPSGAPPVSAALPPYSPPPEVSPPIPLDHPPPIATQPEAAAPPSAQHAPAPSRAPAIPPGQPAQATMPSPPSPSGASHSAEGSPPPISAASPPSAAAQPAPPTKEASAAPGPSAPHAAPRNGGAFLWPVRGRVLEGYGAGPDGTHNDGINIAAPRGAAVEATDGGVVAYAGNELRGYGGLVLIKHPNGWISAYAHCDLILVKTGQKVARGQVIARVGSTGNVSEPQLHFELRRGKKPVDPSEYLTPLPTAANREAHPG